MICPNCAVQMHQHEKIGGGEANDDLYSTWELKKCPICGRLTIEYYEAVVVKSKEEAIRKMNPPFWEKPIGDIIKD